MITKTPRQVEILTINRSLQKPILEPSTSAIVVNATLIKVPTDNPENEAEAIPAHAIIVNDNMAPSAYTYTEVTVTPPVDATVISITDPNENQTPPSTAHLPTDIKKAQPHSNQEPSHTKHSVKKVVNLANSAENLSSSTANTSRQQPTIPNLFKKIDEQFKALPKLNITKTEDNNESENRKKTLPVNA